MEVSMQQSNLPFGFATYELVELLPHKIPKIEFLLLDWIYRSIRIMAACWIHCAFRCWKDAGRPRTGPVDDERNKRKRGQLSPQQV